MEKKKLKIKAVAVLNEDNPEFFLELLKKGADAVEPEMKKQLKKIMTDIAAGHITKKEAVDLIKGEKTPQIKPEKEIKGKSKGSKNNTRKRSIKSKEVK